MKKQWKQLLFPFRGLGGFYIAVVLCVGASCDEKAMTSDAECANLPTVTTFKDEEAIVSWRPVDYPDMQGLRFQNRVGGWDAYSICMLPKELQINELKVRCSGRTVKTKDECGPNVKGCNMNSVIVESYVILSKPLEK